MEAPTGNARSPALRRLGALPEDPFPSVSWQWEHRSGTVGSNRQQQEGSDPL